MDDSKSQLGTGPYRRVHKNLVVKESHLEGKALHVVNEPIPAGAVVFHLRPGEFPRYTWEQIQAMPEEERTTFMKYCLAVDDDLYDGPKTLEEIEKNDLSCYWNHSCDPNCWVYNDDYHVARRDIQVGEEVTVDYSTYEGERSLAAKGFDDFQCRCGASDCRGSIKADAYKDEKFRNKYDPHFPSHIKRKIEAHLKKEAEEKST